MADYSMFVDFICFSSGFVEQFDSGCAPSHLKSWRFLVCLCCLLQPIAGIGPVIACNAFNSIIHWWVLMSLQPVLPVCLYTNGCIKRCTYRFSNNSVPQRQITATLWKPFLQPSFALLVWHALKCQVTTFKVTVNI